MARPSKKITMSWSPDFAYVIGVITADGNLSPDRRHISIVSKDREIIAMCKKALGISNKIGRKSRGGMGEKKYYVLQFGSVIFYGFLLNIHLTAAKSKTIRRVAISHKYFADFLRGYMDGDGSISAFKHPESKRPQVRLTFASGSLTMLKWVKAEIVKHLNLNGGWIYTDKRKDVHTLCYAKSDAKKILNFVYYENVHLKLTRKFRVARRYMGE